MSIACLNACWLTPGARAAPACTDGPACCTRLHHYAENSDHRDCAAASAHLRAAIPATTATEAARPMVPRGLGGERQLLRSRLRQGAASCSKKRLVPVRLARERQVLHPLMEPVCAATVPCCTDRGARLPS